LKPRCVVCGCLMRGDPCPRCGGSLKRDDLLRPARRGGPVEEFVTGMRIAVRGASLTLARPRLLSLVAIPVLLNLLFFASLVWLILANRESGAPSGSAFWRRAAELIGLADIDVIGNQSESMWVADGPYPCVNQP